MTTVKKRRLIGILLPLLAFAQGLAAGESAHGTHGIEPLHREVEAVPGAEIERVATSPLVAATADDANAKESPSGPKRPHIVILLDTGLGSAVIEAAARDIRVHGAHADIEVLVRGLPVIRNGPLIRTDAREAQARLAPLFDAGAGATIDPGRFASLLAQVEAGLEAGGRLDPLTQEVFEVMTSAPTAPAVLITIGHSVYAVSGTASISEALAQWKRTLEDAAPEPGDFARLAPLKAAFARTPLGRPAP